MNSGTNVTSVIAADYSGNKATNRYQVVVAAGADGVLTYDLNGNLSSISNLLSSSVVAYEWDAANRLVAIQRTATNRTEFAYDGMSRRTKISEINSGVTNTVRLLWCGAEICEERDSSGGTVNKKYLAQGVQVSTNAYFYTRDHLGSIREMTDNSGTIRARYDYDPYGRRTKLSGDLEADLGFTGHYYHSPSGLHLAWYRAYDADLGRWLSRDPVANAELLPEGPNLYAYVRNDPTNLLDPTGEGIVLPVVGGACIAACVGFDLCLIFGGVIPKCGLTCTVSGWRACLTCIWSNMSPLCKATTVGCFGCVLAAAVACV
jgi:RHS repeat-associated protein